MTYEKNIVLSGEAVDRVNQLMCIQYLDDFSDEELKKMGAKIDDFIPVCSVAFEDGKVLDIDVYSNLCHYYDNRVLKDANGHEIATFDCSYYVSNYMAFTHKDNTYIVTIEKEYNLDIEGDKADIEI